MRIRAATEDDFTKVVKLYAEFASGPDLRSRPRRQADWRAIVSHPGTTVFVAEEVVRLVGMATLHVLPNMTRGGQPYALIENVLTASSDRNRGIGRKVMERAIEAAAAENAYKIMLLTNKYRGDDDARGFYEKLGFTADAKFGMVLRPAAGQVS